MEKKKIINIDDYISMFSKETQKNLELLRSTIKKAVPEAEEVISYQMPAFKYYGILCWFAAFKNHYSFFVRPKFLLTFKDELKQYDLSKSALKIPLNEPVPVKLITKIVKLVVKENLEKKQSKK